MWEQDRKMGRTLESPGRKIGNDKPGMARDQLLGVWGVVEGADLEGGHGLSSPGGPSDGQSSELRAPQDSAALVQAHA